MGLLMSEIAAGVSPVRRDYCVRMVTMLARHGADIDAQVDGQSLLSLAIHAGNTETTVVLLNSGASYPSDMLHTVLREMLAIKQSLTVATAPKPSSILRLVFLEEVVVQMIIAISDRAKNGKGENLNSLVQGGDTPLDLALRLRNERIVMLLMNHDCDVDRNNTLHAVLSEIADGVASGRPDYASASSVRAFLELSVVEMLRHGARMDTVVHSCTPLQLAIQASSHLAFVLMENGANVNLHAPLNTMMHAMTRRPSIERLLFLKSAACMAIGLGANVNHFDGRNYPLQLASTIGDRGLVSSLLEHGADFNTLDPTSKLPLLLATVTDYADARLQMRERAKAGEIVSTDRFEFLEWFALTLLRSGASVNVRDAEGISLMFTVIVAGNLAVLSLLLENKNINVDEVALGGGHRGRTPLLAVLAEKSGMAPAPASATGDAPSRLSFLHDASLLLISRGCNVNCKMEVGAKKDDDIESDPSVAPSPVVMYSALTVAARCQDASVFRALIDAGASVNVDPSPVMVLSMELGDTGASLSQARREFLEASIVSLVGAKAAVNILDINGCSPLTYAIRASSDTVLQALMAVKCDVNLVPQGSAPGSGALLSIIKNMAMCPTTPSRLAFLDRAALALISGGAACDDGIGHCSTALIHAYVAGRQAVMTSLINRGASVNVREVVDGVAGRPILLMVLQELIPLAPSGQRAVFLRWAAKSLIEAGAEIDTVDPRPCASVKSCTALRCAVAASSEELFDLLISRGCDVNVKAPDGCDGGATLPLEMMLQLCVLRETSLARAREEQRRGKEAVAVVATTSDPTSPTPKLGKKGKSRVNVMEKESVVDEAAVSAVSPAPSSPAVVADIVHAEDVLPRAAFLTKSITRCLKQKAALEVVMGSDTMLRCTIRGRDDNMFKLLLQCGARVNGPSSVADGMSPLSFAVKQLADLAAVLTPYEYRFLVGAIRTLLDIKGNPNSTQSPRPVDSAVAARNLEVLTMLLDGGADAVALDAATDSTLLWRVCADLAAHPDDADLVKAVTLLIDRGVDVNTCVDGVTLLDHIIHAQNMELFKKMISLKTSNIEDVANGKSLLTRLLQQLMARPSDAFLAAVVVAIVGKDANVNADNDTSLLSLLIACTPASFDHSFVVKFLSRGAVADGKDSTGRPVLHQALDALVTSPAQSGHWENVCVTLINAGCDVNAAWEEAGPLDKALHSGSDRVSAALLAKGATYGRAILHTLLKELASSPKPSPERAHFLSTVSASLVVAGADVELELDGLRPLDYAVKAADGKVTALIMERVSDPNVEDERGQSLLTRMVSEISSGSVTELRLAFLRDVALALQSRSVNVLHQVLAQCRNVVGQHFAGFLVANGAPLDRPSPSHDNEIPLHAAAASGYDDVVELCINQGADINAQSASGETPLIKAVRCGHVVVTKRLIQGGADPNLKGGRNVCASPLHVAVSNADVASFTLLMGVGTIDVNMTAFYGRSALHVALSGEGGDTKAKMAIALLAAGANPNLCDVDGCTPLVTAVRGGHSVDLVKGLVAAGADATLVDSRGWSARHWALASADLAMLAAVGGVPSDRLLDDSLLVAAAQSGNVEVMTIVAGGRALCAGPSSASMTAVVTWPAAALHLAAWFGQGAMLQHLLSSGGDPSLPDSRGRTLLHWLVAWGDLKKHLPLIPVVLSFYPALSSCVDSAGHSALAYARHVHNVAAIAALGGDQQEDLDDGWCDPDFTPSATSLGQGPLNAAYRLLSWKRLSQLAPQGVAPPSSVDSLLTSASPLTSPLVVVAMQIAARLPTVTRHPDFKHAYVVTLDGDVTVTVDDFVPVTLEGEPAFGAGVGALAWFAIVYKALAKLAGSFSLVQRSGAHVYTLHHAGGPFSSEAAGDALAGLSAVRAGLSLPSSLDEKWTVDATATLATFSLSDISLSLPSSVICLPGSLSGAATHTFRRPVFCVKTKTATAITCRVTGCGDAPSHLHVYHCSESCVTEVSFAAVTGGTVGAFLPMEGSYLVMLTCDDVAVDVVLTVSCDDALICGRV